ncbi:MAG: alpha/beta hydrolase [Bacteroidota bacterium]
MPSTQPFSTHHPSIILLVLLGLFSFCKARAQNSSSSTDSTDRSPLFTSFDGTKIHYEIEGKGKPVVLIHGFINTSDNWKKSPLFQDLLKNDFQVINLDLRGNGKSDHPHALASYQHDAEAQDIMDLAKFLGLKHYAVVGYSRGSIIAARLLVLAKGVQVGVLGGMGSGFTDPHWERREAFYRAFSGEADVPAYTKGAVNYAKSIGADIVALAQMQGAQPSTSPEELRRLKKPVLVIAGDKDVDNGSAAELTQLLGNATYESVTDGDHNNTMRRAEFSTAVVNFLKTH